MTIAQVEEEELENFLDDELPKVCINHLYGFIISYDSPYRKRSLRKIPAFSLVSDDHAPHVSVPKPNGLFKYGFKYPSQNQWLSIFLTNFIMFIRQLAQVHE